MKTFEEYLEEGKNDPAIFKAVFMAGGPGSGKSYVSQKLALEALGFRPINSDLAFEYLMKRENVSFKMDDREATKRDALRSRAKSLTGSKQALSVNGRLGLLIDGTGREYAKIKKIKDNLEEVGYETMMVFVNTSLDTALERNQMRARTVPEKIVKRSWQDVQNNIGKFQTLFSNRMIVIDNNEGEPDVKKAYSRIRSFSKQPPKMSVAKKWIESQ